MLCALFVVALAWRLFALWRLVHSPLAAGHLQMDSEAYWDWAQVITRRGWLGQNAFFQGPLYPYLLAISGLTRFDSWIPAAVLQCVMGAVTTVLVAVAARRFSAAPFAMAVGCWWALDANATFLDVSLLMESVLTLMTAGLVVLLIPREPRACSTRRAAAAGALIGLVIVGRATAVGLIPAALLAIWPRSTGRARFALCLTALITVSPLVIRHVALGHGPILTTYSFGINMFIGNGPDANGTSRFPGDRLILRGPRNNSEAEGVAYADGRDELERRGFPGLTAKQSSDQWWQLARAHIVTHPAETARLLLRKLLLALNAEDLWQVGGARLYERTLGPLGLPYLLGFILLGPVGLLGLAHLGRSSARTLLLGIALTALATMVVFFVVDRYRIHLTLPLAIAAGPGLAALTAALRSPFHAIRSRPLVWAAVVGLVVIAAQPLDPWRDLEAEFQRRFDIALAHTRQSDYASATLELRAGVALMQQGGDVLARSSAARRNLAQAASLLGQLEQLQGETEAAVTSAALATEVWPKDPERWLQFASALALAGRTAECEGIMRSHEITTGQVTTSLMLLAERAGKENRLEVTEPALRAALAVDSTHEGANVVLLRLLSAQGRQQEAAQHEQAMRDRGLARMILPGTGGGAP